MARELVRDLGPYVTARASGRLFGFVIGGLHPAAWGAELRVSTWNQNAGLFPPHPQASRLQKNSPRQRRSFSGTTYRGERLMRISVSDWATDQDDVDRTVAALLRQAQLARG